MRQPLCAFRLAAGLVGPRRLHDLVAATLLYLFYSAASGVAFFLSVLAAPQWWVGSVVATLGLHYEWVIRAAEFNTKTALHEN